MKYSRRDIFFLTTLLLIVLAAGAGLRFYNLAGQSLWSDEGNSAALAVRSFAQITQDAAHDIHPPLYYWLLHAWTSVFGIGEIALRTLSAALGVLLIFALAEMARRLYGEPTGLAVALVAALAPFQVYYSQEARMYILLALLVVASMHLFSLLLMREEQSLREGLSRQWWRRPPAYGIPLAACWVAGMYTHYAFPLVIALTTGLYLVWLMLTAGHGHARRRLLGWLALLALTLACFAPWLPIAWRQITSWPTGGATMDAAAGLTTSLTLLGLGPTARAAATGWQVWVLVGLALLGALPWRALLSPFARPPHADPDTGAETHPPDSARAPAPAELLLSGLAGSQVVPVGAGLAAARLHRDALGAARGGGLAWGAAVGLHVAHAAGSHPAARVPSRAWYWLRWLILVTWLLAPITMMLALGLFRDAYLKFLLIASPAYVLLLARGVIGPANALSVWGRARGREAGPGKASPHLRYDAFSAAWVIGTLVLISLISGTALNRYFTDPHVARDDYRDMAQFITATAQDDDAILLDAPGQAEVFRYYYHGALPVLPLPRQRPLDRVATLAELSQLNRYNKVYVLYWASQEADPEGVIENWLDNRSYKMLDQWHGNVRLVVYMMPEQSAPDQTADELNLGLGPNITLLGYRAWNLTPHAGEVTQLQLVWRADTQPARRYKVFLQLLDSRDQVIAQRDAEPIGESRPTDSWTPGEIILDNHGLLIPPGTPPGTYRRIVGMYDRDTLQRLRLSGGDDHIDLPPIKVERSPVAPPLAALDMQFSQNFDFGGIKLLGYDRYKRDFKHAPETPLYAGDRLHLTLFWQANVQPRADWWFSLSLMDSTGHQVAEFQAPLVGPTYSTTLWEAQEIVRGEHDLALPASLAPDTYRLSLTLLPDTNTPAGVAYLGTVQVQTR